MQSFTKIYRCLIDSFKGSSQTTSEPLNSYHMELAYSIKDALIAQIFEGAVTDNSDWTQSWRDVQEHLKSSRYLLGKVADKKLVSSELYKNDAICEIMLDGNILHDQKSPRDVVRNINLLLRNAKDEAPDEESNELYPISEWQRLNRC
jgi:hypothetical protein